MQSQGKSYFLFLVVSKIRSQMTHFLNITLLVVVCCIDQVVKINFHFSSRERLNPILNSSTYIDPYSTQNVLRSFIWVILNGYFFDEETRRKLDTRENNELTI